MVESIPAFWTAWHKCVQHFPRLFLLYDASYVLHTALRSKRQMNTMDFRATGKPSHHFNEDLFLWSSGVLIIWIALPVDRRVHQYTSRMLFPGCQKFLDVVLPYIIKLTVTLDDASCSIIKHGERQKILKSAIQISFLFWQVFFWLQRCCQNSTLCI